MRRFNVPTKTLLIAPLMVASLSLEAGQNKVIIHSRAKGNSHLINNDCGINASDIAQLCRIAKQRRAKEQAQRLAALRKKALLQRNARVAKAKKASPTSQKNNYASQNRMKSTQGRVSRNIIVRDQSTHSNYLYTISPAPVTARQIRSTSSTQPALSNIGPQQVAIDSNATNQGSNTETLLKTTRSSATGSVQTVNASQLSSATSNASVAETKPARRMIPVDDFKSSISIFTDGPAVGDPLGGYQTDKYDGFETDDRVEMTVAPTLGYRFHPNYTFSVNPNFLIRPSNPRAEGTAAENVFMKPKESFFRVGVGEFFAVDGFKWNGDFRVYPGITDDMTGTPLYLRTGQNFSYAFDKSAWSIGLENTIRYYHRTDTKIINTVAGGSDPYDFRVTSSPNINYQATDRLGLSLSYNWDWRHPINAPSSTDAWIHAGDGPYTEFNISYDLTSSVNISPYIQTFVRRVDVYTMPWGINLRWTLL